MKIFLYGKLDATDEEMIAAAKAVNAHEFIMKMGKRVGHGVKGARSGTFDRTAPADCICADDDLDAEDSDSG